MAPPHKIKIGANGKSSKNDNKIPEQFIIIAKKIDNQIIIAGVLDVRRAIIAGISIMLVTNNAPTIFIVAIIANDKIDKKRSSSIFTDIPFE